MALPGGMGWSRRHPSTRAGWAWSPWSTTPRCCRTSRTPHTGSLHSGSNSRQLCCQRRSHERCTWPVWVGHPTGRRCPWCHVRPSPIAAHSARISRPFGVRGRIVPGHEDHRVVTKVFSGPSVRPVLGRRMTSSGNEPRILGIGHWVNVDIERWQPCGFISWPRQENAPVNLGHQSTIHRVANVTLSDRFRDRTIGLRSHQRAPGEEGKARLGIGITSRQRCVESRLIDRPGADISRPASHFEIIRSLTPKCAANSRMLIRFASRSTRTSIPVQR